MKAKSAVVLGVLLLCAPYTSAYPQGGLFDRGRDVLRDFGLGAPGPEALSDGEIAKGLVEALKVGTERVVSALGRTDGFNGSPDVHIPLPRALDRVKRALQPLGMAGMGEDLELRLNRAAEAAVPRAKALFWKAIESMTLDDVRGIYNGPKNAATQYFRGKMSAPLAQEMAPIVGDELAQVGAIQSYDRMMGRYRQMPFVPDAKADLTEYVVGKAIDGVFLYLGREEAAIRENPAKRTTELLKKVFSAR